jgi:beta-lactamase regulating signal transducer with metallopeptidase domain
MNPLWYFVILFVAIVCIAILMLFSRVLDSLFPTKEQEEQRARRDVEEMLKRANQETVKRPRVRAGTQL